MVRPCVKINNHQNELTSIYFYRELEVILSSYYKIRMYTNKHLNSIREGILIGLWVVLRSGDFSVFIHACPTYDYYQRRCALGQESPNPFLRARVSTY